MGLSLFASRAYERVRPRFMDEVETYDPGDRPCLFLVTKRDPAQQGRWYTRRINKILAWLDDTYKPGTPYEIQALVTSEARADAGCKDKNWDYAPLPVDTFFPDRLCRWPGVMKPRAWFQANRAAPEPELFRQITVSQWKDLTDELQEWRTGKRETAAVSILRRQADTLTRLARFEQSVDSKFDDLERRVRALERGRLDARTAAAAG